MLKRTVVLLCAVFQTSSSTWEIASKTGPDPRYINEIVSTEQGLMIFGGKNNRNDGFNDLWKWNGEKWEMISIGVSPRWDHGIAYMGKQNKLVVFGGRLFNTETGEKKRLELGDSWVYQNGTWKILELMGPGPRSSFSISYDEKRDRVVLFGGRSDQEIFNDTWEFDGTEWQKIQVSGPGGKYGHSMCYDKKSESMYLFGGFDGNGLLDDFWNWNGDEWMFINNGNKPSPRMAHAMQFNNRGLAILFGGYATTGVSTELWIWNDGQWTLSNSSDGPGARLSHALGYDSTNDIFLLFGGSSDFGQGFFPNTWSLKLNEY